MRRRWKASIPLLAFTLVAGRVHAQQPAPTGLLVEDSALASLSARLARLARIEVPAPYAAAPAHSAFVPSAFGGWRGSFGVSVQMTPRARYRDRADGTLGVVVPLGEPTTLGLDVGVAILDLRPDDGEGGFGQRGSFSARVHRLLGWESAVALGVENALNWGGTDAPVSVYGVVSRRIGVSDRHVSPTRVFVSAGAGHGRFGKVDDVNTSEGEFGVFASVSVDLQRAVATFVEWTGEDLAAGASFVPVRALPVVITTAVTDLTGNAGDGARFYFGIGSGFLLP